ncbi:MAG TPA: sugar phosphate nucleotidyltransferase [Bacteroidia bacterium]|nr:sugar phosphate nucleotidyltransferase [Bacteroidia bacterium]
MKLIIPMAGIGKRMRPHTLTVPKPLLPVAGKPMVQHLVEDICKMTGEKVDEIGFVIGNFGKEVEQNLLKVAEKMGAKGKIFYQKEALGTAHAVLCAAEMLEGKTIVAFADTLFRGEVKIDASKDGVIWVQKVEDPRPFGVVKMDKQNIITDFIEKPQEFVSDMAIIGIYYFKDGAYLHKEMQYLIDNSIKDKGEYQLTNALENMKKKGTKFTVAEVAEWLDCGNKDNMLYTNKRILETKEGRKTTKKTENSIIIEPCYIDETVSLKNSIVGPYVSIGANTKIENAVISDSIIQDGTTISNSNIAASMIGSYVLVEGKQDSLNIGDYNQYKN